MLHKKFNQDLATYNFLSKKVDSCKIKVCLRFKLFKNFCKAVHKNKPLTRSPQQNKKALLMTAAYFKVSTPVRSQRQ